MTRFLDKMEVYLNIPLGLSPLEDIADQIELEVNESLKEVPFDIKCRVFMTYRRANHARKTASFRSYVEYVSKLEVVAGDNWKTYTKNGNIVAVFNKDIKKRIVLVQESRAEEAIKLLTKTKTGNS